MFAQHAGIQRQILIQQGFRRLDFCLFLNVFPHFGQVVDVGLKLLVGGVFGVGAMQPWCVFGQQVGQAFAVAALGIVFDAGKCRWSSCGRWTRKRPANEVLSGKACAFGINRVFDDLHQNRLPFKKAYARCWVSSGLRRCSRTSTMWKCRAFQTDVDERALHSRQHAALRPDKYCRPDYDRCCVRCAARRYCFLSNTATRVSRA